MNEEFEVIEGQMDGETKKYMQAVLDAFKAVYPDEQLNEDVKKIFIGAYGCGKYGERM